MLRLFILSPYIIAQTKTRNIKITRFSEYFGTGLPMKLSIPITLSPPDGGKALSIFSEKIMQSVIVELDTNAQLEALKKYIQDLWGKISTLKKEDAQILTANSEMNMFGAALRGHSSKVLSKHVQNETESMF